jgi:hypothetical protein
MTTFPVRMDHVFYNAANQSFEAAVTVYDQGRMHKYACAFQAPITMTFEDATGGLARQARRRHLKRDGLCSVCEPTVVRPRPTRRRFDLGVWLEGLIRSSGSRAA